MIAINRVHRLNEIGGRANNEDSIYPPLTAQEYVGRLFMVCDGVGGANKGEVASHLTCETFSEYCATVSPEEINERFVRDVVSANAHKFREHYVQNTSSKGMGTTITLAYIKDQSVVIAWCGDSRVYHVRNGEIIFRSKDHSLVANLVANGEITEQEAAQHPKKNLIFRVMNAETSPEDPEVRELTDIQDGDYILLCSDGLLEVADDNIISGLLNKENGQRNFTEEFRNFCEGNTADNYSMYLLQLSSDKKTGSAVPEVPATKSKKSRWLLISLMIAAALTAGIYWMKKADTNVPPAAKSPADNPRPNTTKQPKVTTSDPGSKEQTLPLKSSAAKEEKTNLPSVNPKTRIKERDSTPDIIQPPQVDSEITIVPEVVPDTGTNK